MLKSDDKRHPQRLGSAASSTKQPNLPGRVRDNGVELKFTKTTTLLSTPSLSLTNTKAPSLQRPWPWQRQGQLIAQHERAQQATTTIQTSIKQIYHPAYHQKKQIPSRPHKHHTNYTIQPKGACLLQTIKMQRGNRMHHIQWCWWGSNWVGE